MTSAPTSLEPRLAPPGAGLRWLELRLARLGFRFLNHRATPAATTDRLKRERDAILALVRGISPEEGTHRVLIPRLPGLEDSSRFWSVFMTLDHLRIVNDAVAETITLLSAGRVPDLPASTAAVKPSPAADASVMAAFARSCAALRHAAKASPDLRTAARFAHPWFGPLDAAGWFFMAAFHLGLHRKQIQRIQAARPKTLALIKN